MSSSQTESPRYARNNFPIEVVYDIVPTLDDRDTERLRAERTDKDRCGLLDIRYRHLDPPESASPPVKPNPDVDLTMIRPGRETPESQLPGADWSWISQYVPQESRVDRFDGNFIRFRFPADGGSRYQEFVSGVVAEMKDPNSAFADEMAVLDRSTNPNEKEVQEAFCRLANEIARRATSLEPDRSFTIDAHDESGQIPQVFLSRGLTHVREEESQVAAHGEKDYILPCAEYVDQNKPDIFFNYWQGIDLSSVESPFWSQLAGAAEVTSTSRWDMRMHLTTQLARYQLYMGKHHATTGEMRSFTLCRDLLRVFYFNSSRWGSSRAMSFAEPEEYEDIVMTVLFFSGPCHNFLPVWAPREGMVIETEGTEGELSKYVVGNVKVLASQESLWGRRTAVWSCEVDEPEVSQQSTSILAEDENLIIKAAWNTPQLKNHELILYRYILEKQRQGLTLGENLHIPTPIGSIKSSSVMEGSSSVDIANWHTHPAMMADLSGLEHLEATTLVTKCKKAVEVFGLYMSPRQHLCYFRNFFRMLRYLATCDIHYRDVNPGNILCDAETHSICILADFEISRIGMLPRGCEPGVEPVQRLSDFDASLDDSRSANLYFMCRRVQETAELQAEFNQTKNDLLKAEQQAKKFPSPKRTATLQGIENDLNLIKQSIIDNYHTYIYDAESTVYNMLWTMSRRGTSALVGSELTQGSFNFRNVARMTVQNDRFPPKSLTYMHNSKTKINIWKRVHQTAADLNYDETWAEALDDIAGAFTMTQGLVMQHNERSRTGPLDCELDCYDKIDEIIGKAIDDIDSGAS